MSLAGIRRFAFAPLAVLALGTALLTAAPSASADQRDFRVVNDSNSTIMRLYVSPASSDRWGPDQLGDGVIHPGNSFSLHFDQGQAGNTCLFDLRIVTASGSAVEKHEVNLCRTSTVTYS